MKDVAVRTTPTSQPSTSLFPTETEWAMLKEQAQMVVRTGLLPAAIKTPEQAIAVGLKGREMGIPFMHATAHIHIVQGKPTMSAELMLALIYKNCPGAVINYLESNTEICTIEAARPGHKTSTFSYTMKEAQLAGLTGKSSWKQYPAAMLRARTVAIVARAVFPDAIMGVSYTPEEMGAEVQEDGELIVVQSGGTGETDTGSQNIEAKDPPVKPKGARATAEEPSAKSATESATAKPTKKSVGVEIMQAAYQLGMKDADVMGWMQEEYNCAPKEMTLEQLMQFRDKLHFEIGCKGEEVRNG